MKKASDFDLVTVDWNPRQTQLWKRYVNEHCPSANIVLVKDTKPIPWCWSSGKLNCFADLPQLKHPGRFMYMDTDAIVTHDLAELFDKMGDAHISVSSDIPGLTRMSHWTRERKKDVDAAFGIQPTRPVIHYSTGLVALALSPKDLGFSWHSAMNYPPLRLAHGGHRCFEEIAFSYVLAADNYSVWHQPLSIHGNILGAKIFFGDVQTPWVIHYHTERRLRTVKLGHYLE